VRGDDVGREVKLGRAKRVGCGLAPELQWRAGRGSVAFVEEAAGGSVCRGGERIGEMQE
jgi:hypothetical protein